MILDNIRVFVDGTATIATSQEVINEGNGGHFFFLAIILISLIIVIASCIIYFHFCKIYRRRYFDIVGIYRSTVAERLSNNKTTTENGDKIYVSESLLNKENDSLGWNLIKIKRKLRRTEAELAQIMMQFSDI
ncbi:MAG: hypothetical protein KBS85_04865 [Lachnospiraceae bacterium]|nr:hypothetical protein [Candidatus Merdinaster equi]